MTVLTCTYLGRYWANISDTLLTGQMKQWKEGELQARTFHSGKQIYNT